MLASIVHGANLKLMRRWVVFPFAADSSLQGAADNAWWKCRERLTEKKKFLVASRQFLIQKEVFQPRKELKPQDVKLLADLLDADVIVTGYSENRQFALNVYLAQNGSLFWTKKINFHPSLKAGDQLELISDRITQELIAQIPYQGFTIVDPLIGKSVYEDAGRTYSVVDLGTTEDIAIGHEVQWVDIIIPDTQTKSPELAESQIVVIGEGRIAKLKRGVAIAEVLRAKSRDAIVEKTLVRIPKEAERLAKTYLSDEPGWQKLAPELIPSAVAPISTQSHESHRSGVFLGGILGILGIIALAL